MINDISNASRSDAELARLLEEARDYAHMYLAAKQRQKGCDGMGELTGLREEFQHAIDKMISYCKGKKIIQEDLPYTMDLIAREITDA